MKKKFNELFYKIHEVFFSTLASISGLVGTVQISYPIIIKTRNNIIIGSLGLIIIKFFFFTTFKFRILCLIIFTIISTIFDIREKIKPPISRVLAKLIGWEYYSESVGYQFAEKRDYVFSHAYLCYYGLWGEPGESAIATKIRTIQFELSYFFRGLIFQFYYFLTSFRFALDLYPWRSILIHYIIIFTIIYYDIATILLYTGAFLTLSRLIVYRVENSFSEVKAKMQYYIGLNPEKELKICRINNLIFLYWTMRDLDFYTQADYITKTYILTWLGVVHNYKSFNVVPFKYKEETVINPIINGTIIGFVYSAKQSINSYSSSGKGVLSICKGHDIHIVIEEKGEKYVAYFLNETSSKNGLLREGGKPALQHKDFSEENEYCTQLAPVFFKEFSNKNEIIDFTNNIYNFHFKREIETTKNLLGSKSIKRETFYNLDSGESVTNPIIKAQIKECVDFHKTSVYDIKSESIITPFDIANKLSTGENFKANMLEAINHTQNDIKVLDLDSKNYLPKPTLEIKQKLNEKVELYKKINNLDIPATGISRESTQGLIISSTVKKSSDEL
jgi:hypothetical protein